MEPVPVPSPARKMYWLPIHQYFLEIFLYWSVHQYTSPKHTWTSMWPKGEGQFSLGENFQKCFGGWKIFPTPFLVNFDVFLVDFDAKIHMRGENLPKIPNGGWKITTRTTPQTGGKKFWEFFRGGEKFFSFPCPCGLCMYAIA